MSTVQFNLSSNCGETPTPGVETLMYAVCVCDILDPFPQPPTTGVQGATMVIVDDILLEPLKAWKTIKIIIDSGELTDEQKGSGSYDQGFAFKTVTDENYDEFFNTNGKACFLFLVVQKDGKKRLIGHPTKGPAMLVGSKRTGGINNESNAEWSSTVVATPGNVMYYYNGEIDLDETT
jgi:hypothetical protein